MLLFEMDAVNVYGIPVAAIFEDIFLEIKAAAFTVVGLAPKYLCLCLSRFLASCEKLAKLWGFMGKRCYCWMELLSQPSHFTDGIRGCKATSSH